MTERHCIVTRVVKDEADLIRFVRSPDGVATPDLQRKLPGRGCWVSVSQAAVAEAVKRNGFSRGFGEATQAPADLPEMVGTLLKREALSSVALARKAGAAVCGFMKVEDRLRKGNVRVLIHAREAAADGIGKLDRLSGPETTVLRHFAGADLDVAFGRTNVVHAAISSGGVAEKLNYHAQRWAAYQGLIEEKT
jgi:uncharacterized protein